MFSFVIYILGIERQLPLLKAKYAVLQTAFEKVDRLETMVGRINQDVSAAEHCLLQAEATLPPPSDTSLQPLKALIRFQIETLLLTKILITFYPGQLYFSLGIRRAPLQHLPPSRQPQSDPINLCIYSQQRNFLNELLIHFSPETILADHFYHKAAYFFQHSSPFKITVARNTIQII